MGRQERDLGSGWEGGEKTDCLSGWELWKKTRIWHCAVLGSSLILSPQAFLLQDTIVPKWGEMVHAGHLVLVPAMGATTVKTLEGKVANQAAGGERLLSRSVRRPQEGQSRRAHAQPRPAP